MYESGYPIGGQTLYGSFTKKLNYMSIAKVLQFFYKAICCILHYGLSIAENWIPECVTADQKCTTNHHKRNVRPYITNAKRPKNNPK